jgi:hypothetical protein
MENLRNYLIESFTIWYDAHIHLFNHIEPIKRPSGFTKVVGFMDLEYDAEEIDVIGAYDNFIQNDLTDDVILLATGVTIDDIKAVYSKYKAYIKGFGELKCYDEYKGEKVPYKQISFVKDVCELSSKNGNLPVYIHWDLNDQNDVDKIEEVLANYPNIPLVLCHSGMNESNMDFAYENAVRLQNQYDNLWIDISYSALDHLYDNIDKVIQYDPTRIIVGTDLNNKLWGPNHNTPAEVRSIITKYKNLIYIAKIDNILNMDKLFVISEGA